MEETMQRTRYSSIDAVNTTIINFIHQVTEERLDEPEAILAFLRRNGCPKPSSMIVLMDILGCSLGEARDRTHVSPTWADVRERDERVIEEFFDVLESLESEI